MENLLSLNLIFNFDQLLDSKESLNIKKIIDILNNNKIDFKEINTFEGDLEDVFIKVVNKHDANI